MKRVVTLFLALVCAFSLQAQKSLGKSWPADDQKKLKSAQVLMENGFHKTAYTRYTELLKLHPEELYLKYKLGVCGLYIDEKHKEALQYLTDVYAADKKAMDIEFYMAVLYHRTYQFDKSIELANKLLSDKKLNPKDKPGIEQLIIHSQNGQILVQKPNDVKIENIGATINTEASEYAPVMTSDEETMFYTYRGKECLGGLFDMNNNPDPDGDYNEDIFMAKKVDGIWQKPESVIELNTIENDAAIGLSNDGQQMFLFKANATDNGDIYVSKLENGKFENAEKLKGDVNSNSWEGSVTQSSDNRKIIFASERPGGFGGKDLYVASRMADNSWGNVKNLGSTVNTNKDEDAPFLHPDGRSLVFSSEGHNSMGGFDIFVSDLDDIDSTWKSPVNIGYPVNSTNDDVFYVISADGKRGYYSSIKSDGFGDHDIYSVEPAIASKKSSLTVIKGKMTENLFPVESGEINVTVLNDGRNFGSFKPNANSGHFLVNLPSGYDYNINFYHPIFGDKNIKVKTDRTSDYSEKFVNINFGMSDTSSTNEQIIDFRTPFESQTPNFTATGNNKDEGTVSLTAATAATTAAPIEYKVASISGKPNKTMDPSILAKYGMLKANGLKYWVQVAAYRYPKNYNSSHLKNICTVTEHGKIMGNVVLIVADKEFDNISSACEFLAKVQNAGQMDAFVTAEFNGKRYYINDLPSLEVVNKLFLATK